MKKNAKTISLIYGCVVAVLVVALGITLIGVALHIYLSDPKGDPYSRATIAAHLWDIFPLICVTAVAILGGFFLPSERKKPKAHRGAHANVRQLPAKRLLVIRGVVLIIAVVFIAVGIFNGSARDVLTKAVKICTECIGLG